MTGSPIQEFIEGLGFQYFRILSSSTQDPKTCCKRDLGGLASVRFNFYSSEMILITWTHISLEGTNHMAPFRPGKVRSMKRSLEGNLLPNMYPGREQGTLRSGSNFAAGVNPLQHKGRRMK